MAEPSGSLRKLGIARRMTATTAKPFRCVCEECEPLPPIPGLSAPEEDKTKPVALAAALKGIILRKRSDRLPK